MERVDTIDSYRDRYLSEATYICFGYTFRNNILIEHFRPLALESINGFVPSEFKHRARGG
jgi:hypothetical protein